jgi:hypothetical protein
MSTKVGRSLTSLFSSRFLLIVQRLSFLELIQFLFFESFFQVNSPISLLTPELRRIWSNQARFSFLRGNACANISHGEVWKSFSRILSNLLEMQTDLRKLRKYVTPIDSTLRLTERCLEENQGKAEILEN